MKPVRRLSEIQVLQLLSMAVQTHSGKQHEKEQMHVWGLTAKMVHRP